MNQLDILKRAARLVWQYRGLWWIGVLLALVGGGGGGAGFTGFNPGSFRSPTGNLPSNPNIPNIDLASVLAIVLVLGCVILILALVFGVVRYVLTAGLYQTVHDLDAQGTVPSLRQAWRAGWNGRTWRLFLQDMVVGIPLVLIVLLLVLLVLSPLLLLASSNGTLQGSGVALTLVLGLLLIGVLLLLSVVISILKEFWQREAILADRDTLQSIGSAYRLVRSHLSDVGVMWLLMLAAGIGWGLVLIPVALLVIVIAALIGGVPGYGLYVLTGSTVLGAVVGVPLFLIVLIVPLALLSGLYTAWRSTAWTLVYRQVKA